MTTEFITKELRKEFGVQGMFSREDLFEFYLRFDRELKETTFRWRIFDLKEKKVITPLSKELFSLTYKPVFKPKTETRDSRISTKLSKGFPILKQCIWSTRVLNEFMLHQPGKFITILEVEKDALEPVFHYLQDINTPDVYLSPTEKELERYVYEADSALVLQSLVSKAPIKTLKNQTVPTIEKILVDIFADKKLFSTFQGNELANIINNAYDRYQIDFTRLFSYARRRKKENDLIKYLSQQTGIPQTILND
ncbi:DUF6577 family protein [Sphingobacterium sp. JB170]|uniref:DUF6577 family protein n=1 Tax=Sphingobacterium sp. JB170 TaxID=1434842 RepID=UPI00097F4AF7|nr:DUF6577 family protein [Sphingobacterium sp. JB170]SJN42698.1 hypothetical protein FM107_11735 [Sphingobacterium sp. JB170]